MAHQGSFSGGTDDQDRLLDEATAVVKEQAHYMKRAIDNNNVKEALKHGSNMICELRTSLLSPKNYYELYMRVFQEMQHLGNFFGDTTRHNRKLQDLYESVQHAGNILPRLYLLATVAGSYIKSRESPAKGILTDVSELCKGVQHPIRGLFLRYYLSQMVKDKLPDTGSEFEGEGGDINDAFEFLFNNLAESNRLWCRIQNQGPVKDKLKREKERHDLRVLVGANLVRLSQLEGMTLEFYENKALPRILEHVITGNNGKDTMSQQYLFESMIQVFPDDFHIKTLEQVLAAYTKALPTIDMKPIMVTLMNRLANYLTNSEGGVAFNNMDIFSLFRSHLGAILERALEQPAPGAIGAAALDISAPLEVQAAFLQFTVSLYPDKVHYVDLILGSTVDLLKKFFEKTGDTNQKLGGAGAEKVLDLLKAPLSNLGLGCLEMEWYSKLMGFLNFQTRKQVALQVVAVVVEGDSALDSVDTVSRLLTFISPLLKDEEDTPHDEGSDKETFNHEQSQVCKLVHQIKVEDTDVAFQILDLMRKSFGQGGPNRMAHTLVPVYYGSVGLVPKIMKNGPGQVTVKKVFQFCHKTVTALQGVSPEPAMQLWLLGAALADNCEKQDTGKYEAICYEFLTQALLVFEEEISESTKQYACVYTLTGTLTNISSLDGENFDTVSMKIAQHAARLLKKPLQVRAVATCSHLFWCEARRDGKRVLECLQKCLKITDGVVQSDPKQVGLWVEMLDKYIFYLEAKVEEVTVDFIKKLIALCQEHVGFAESDDSSHNEARKAKAHLNSSLAYVRSQKACGDPETAQKFTEIEA